MFLSYLLHHISWILMAIIAYLLIRRGMKSDRDFYKRLFFNLAAVLIAFSLFFAYRSFMRPINHTWKENKFIWTYSVPDARLGYKIEAGSHHYRVRKKRLFKSIYDVEINTNKDLRLTYEPESSILDRDQASLFLGGSFCFGEGLNDKETLPFLYNAAHSDSLAVFNLGFHGYGPHHALRILKDDTYEILEKFELKNIYYLIIPDHFSRAAGLSDWDEFGPYYKMEDKALIDKGQFNNYVDPAEKSFLEKALNFFYNRTPFKRLLRVGQTRATEIDDVNLVNGIFAEINDIIVKNGGQLTIVLDPTMTEFEFYKHFTNGLNTRGLEYIELNDQMSNFKKKQLFIPGDGHPTMFYNSQILERILLEEKS